MRAPFVTFVLILALPFSACGQNDPQAYAECLTRIAGAHQELRQRYAGAATQQNRRAVLADASAYLERTIVNELIPFWYGTRWSFNGTTEEPRQGSIACGYFVTTVLRDAGYRVERVRMAQQASELIIRSLSHPSNIQRFSRTPLERFLEEVTEQGPGLYVVGLDNHVGFLFVDRQSGVWFLHSSYRWPWKVVREKALDSSILSDSQYRVIGKVTRDAALTEKWILGEPIPTRTR